MKTEKEKMLQGLPYDATDTQILAELNAVKEKVWEYNRLRPSDMEARTALIKELFGTTGERVFVVQPFFCDYGANIEVGEDFFANFNFTVLDEAKVRIGKNAFVGPNVSIYTACHPLNPEERNKMVEWAESVNIGDNVWIGGSVTICPGVTIGDNVTIGAGSVVVGDIPSGTVAVGNPCKVIKHIHIT